MNALKQIRELAKRGQVFRRLTRDRSTSRSPGRTTALRLSKTAIFAFAAVYIIWGSTYVAIRTAIETMPPWGLSAARYAMAGVVMLVLARFRREPKLARDEFRVAAASGPLLVAANGFVCVAEQWVPSGVAAVVIGAMPIWTMLIGWAAFRQAPPSLRKMCGALIGLVGIMIIASGDLAPVQAGSSSFGVLYLVGSSWLWTSGTLIQRRVPNVKSAFAFSGWQMLVGSLLAGSFSLAFEKPWTISWSDLSAASIAAFVYLVVFGSIVGFTAYSWLSRNVEPHLVSTYALVNPLIAVALGAAIYREAIGLDFLLAAGFVGVGLTLLILREPRRLGGSPR